MPTKRSFVLHFPTPEDRAAFKFPQGSPTFFTEGSNPTLKTVVGGVTTPIAGESAPVTVAPEENADFTAVIGSLHLVDVTNESEDPVTITVLPPSNPSEGDSFQISDSRSDAGTNNIIIDFVTATQTFHGASANYTINANKGFANFVYTNETVGWILAN